MNYSEKKETIEHFIYFQKKKLNNYVCNKKYEKALAMISVIAELLYDFNQYYIDDDLESSIKKLNYSYNSILKKDYNPKGNVIIFYDGFGLDTRGVVQMYLNALGKTNYKVIYVTNKKCKSNLYEVSALCNKYNFIMEFIDMSTSYLKWTNELIKLFEKYTPSDAFYYTYPYDSSGAFAFCIFENKVNRYLIDLTDHAFWLGKNSCDYFLGSREMSASNQFYHRGIPKDKCIKLGVNLIVNEETNHDGLPFDVTKERYIFSGGALYKTLGDPNNTYYKIIDYILSNHKDIKFLYAGKGDDSELKKVILKYPERVFHIDERKDFYYLIKNSVFYLNTYPMFGGMMMKYSALAKKLPITLKHNNDSNGLLLNQIHTRIEYDSYIELTEDVDKLLNDNNYLFEREQLLEGSVITEERFCKNIQSLIQYKNTDYYHDFILQDTTQFRREYLERFNLKIEKAKIVKKINKVLFFDFPLLFTINVIKKTIKKIIK